MFAISILLFNCPLAFGAIGISASVPGGQVQQGFDHNGVNSVTVESIPKSVKMKYKLVKWFESQKQCPVHGHSGFAAWDAYKKVMSAAPAITTPDHGITGNRTLEVEGFCGKLYSSDFTCVKTPKEVKAHTTSGKVKIQLDSLTCVMSDITLYKVHPGFYGLRLDFSSCTGNTVTGAHSIHYPKSAAMNMQVGPQTSASAGQNTSLDAFFTAVCAGGPPASFNTMALPNFPVPTKVPNAATQKPYCWAQTAETSHVVGKGCYQDFLWFDLNDANGNMAKISVANWAALTRLIPGEQHLLSPRGFVGPAPPPTPTNPCAIVNGRRLGPCDTSTPPPTQAPTPASNPCAPEEPCAPVTLPPSPPPPATCAQLVCPPSWTAVADPTSVPCVSPSGCSQSDVMSCCIPPGDVPGVVVADRTCIYFKGCLGCNNRCYCTGQEPLVPTTTTTPSKPKHPEFCQDCWVQNLIIAAMAWPICFFVCIVWLLNGILIPQNTTVSKKATPWQNAKGGAQGGMAATMMGASAAQGLFSTSNLDAQGSPGQARIIEEVTESNRPTIFTSSCGIFFFVTCIVVHGLWLVWYFIADTIMGKGWDKTWNCIFLWKCPLSLVPVWIAIWMMLWIQSWFMSYRYSRWTTTETKAGFAYEVQTVAAGGGGAGGGVLGTITQSLGLGGGGGAAYA